MINKKINFIPGLGEKPSDYKILSQYFNIVRVDWNHPKTNLGKVNILAGFSLGAVLAYIHTRKSKVKTVILCSLTPIEYLKGINTDEVIFMVGSKERFCLQNIRRVYKTLKCKKSIVIVRGAGHKITENYRKKLLQVVNQLA